MTKARNIADLGSNDVIETTATGVDVTGTVTADGLGIGTSSPSTKLMLEHNNDGAVGGTIRIKDRDSQQAVGQLTGAIEFESQDASVPTGGVSTAIKAYSASNVGGSYLTISTTDVATSTLDERMRIDSSGKLLVNTTASTDAQVTVKSDSGLHPAIKVSDGGSNGYTLIADNYTTNESQVNLGIMHGSASAVLSWGVKPSDTTDSYVSSTGLYSKPPQALEMDSEGIKFLQGANAQVATDSAVAMSEKARIDSSGNLLVGKTSPNITTLGIELHSSNYIAATADGQAAAYFTRKSSDGDIALFRKNGSTVGSIGAEGGDLVIGTGSTAGLQFNDATPTIRPWNMSANTRTDGVCDLGYSNSRFKDLYLSGGIELGTGNNISWGGSYSAGNPTIACTNDDIIFYPTGNIGGEKARIDSSGNLLVGTTTAFGATGCTIDSGGQVFSKPAPYSRAFYGSQEGASGAIPYTAWMGNASTYVMDVLWYGTTIGSIAVNAGGTGVNYNTTSDERLKENIQDTTHSVNIDDIRVREFDWKANGEHQRYGFIAQELETVYPEAVHSPDNPEEMKAVDYSKLVPLLVKEIQTLKARIETLENN